MPREQLLGLATDVDRLLAAGATAAAGHDGLARRGRALRELGQKVAALLPVADAVERVASSGPREVGRAFLDLAVMARQLRGSLAAVGAEGTLQTVEVSGPWQTPTPTRDVYNAHEALTGDASSAALHDAAERQITGDLRLLPSALAALESSKTSIADTVADKVLPAVGRGVLPDLLDKIDIQKGKTADARRLRTICKIDSKMGAELARKGLSEGSPALKIQALECLPDVGRPGEAEKIALEMWKEKKKEVRVAALRALRKAMGDEALEVLILALPEDDGPLFEAAEEVLAELPHPKATQRLLREVEQRLAALPPPVPEPKKGAKKAVVKAAENAKQARQEALTMTCRFIEVLAGRKDAKSQRVLKTLLDLARHENEQIRSQTVHALAKLGPDVKEVVPALIETLADADSEVADAAADALCELPPDKRERALPALIDYARNAGEDCYIYQVARTLPEHMEHFGDAILDLFAQLLEKKDDHLREAAYMAIDTIGLPARKFLPRILEQMKVGDVSSLVLANIEPEGATSIPALIALLKDSKKNVRRDSLHQLQCYGPKARAAEPLVAKLTKDRDWMVKYYAEQALAAIQGEK